jgi:hypothetical protein
MEELIKRYPNEKVVPQFRKLRQNFPKIRAVRGDGNCFYRAFAFLYLRDRDLTSYQKVFQSDIKNVCFGHSLEFEDDTF